MCSLKVAMLAKLKHYFFPRSASLLSWIAWQLRVTRSAQRGNTCRAWNWQHFAKTILKVQECKVKCDFFVSNYLDIWPELITSSLCDAKVLFGERHNYLCWTLNQYDKNCLLRKNNIQTVLKQFYRKLKRNNYPEFKLTTQVLSVPRQMVLFSLFWELKNSWIRFRVNVQRTWLLLLIDEIFNATIRLLLIVITLVSFDRFPEILRFQTIF